MTGSTERVTSARTQLTDALLATDPFDALASTLAELHIPELVALADLSDDPYGDLHKDNYTHSLRVVAQCGTDATLMTRTAALFHDVGKPATRRVHRGTVTFHDHEVVGVRLTRRRLTALGFDVGFIDGVCQIVLASGRIQAYLPEWTDAAVRRARRDAGDRWNDAITLAKADCTTRHDWKRRRLWASIDELVDRVETVETADRIKAERPVISGDDLIAAGATPGPALGATLRWLLDQNRRGALRDPDEALHAALEHLRGGDT